MTELSQDDCVPSHRGLGCSKSQRPICGAVLPNYSGNTAPAAFDRHATHTAQLLELGASFSMYTNSDAMAIAGSTKHDNGTNTDGAQLGGTKG